MRAAMKPRGASPLLWLLAALLLVSPRRPVAAATAVLAREDPQHNLPPRRSPAPLRRQSGTADANKLRVHPHSALGLARRNNALIEVQPSHVPVYTADGFTVIQTPEYVQEDLLSVLQRSAGLPGSLPNILFRCCQSFQTARLPRERSTSRRGKMTARLAPKTSARQTCRFAATAGATDVFVCVHGGCAGCRALLCFK